MHCNVMEIFVPFLQTGNSPCSWLKVVFTSFPCVVLWELLEQMMVALSSITEKCNHSVKSRSDQDTPVPTGSLIANSSL